jgi:hypothetical protein
MAQWIHDSTDRMPDQIRLLSVQNGNKFLQKGGTMTTATAGACEGFFSKI